jgi:predicted DNA-binding helix-hairpin-helix protein
MIIGATPESDHHILKLSASLYKRLELQRVFFSAYIPVNTNPLLPPPGEVPLLREHRLYQADWLLRFYGFDVDEIIDEQHPFLDPLIDPKCNWALNHIDQFPAEVNRVPYEMLLRIPGIGVRGAKRIMCARRERSLRFEDLGKLNVTLKRARYFITCNGRFAEGVLFDPLTIYRELTRQAQRRRFKGVLDGQLSLFDAAGGGNGAGAALPRFAMPLPPAVPLSAVPLPPLPASVVPLSASVVPPPPAPLPSSPAPRPAPRALAKALP